MNALRVYKDDGENTNSPVELKRHKKQENDQ